MAFSSGNELLAPVLRREANKKLKLIDESKKSNLHKDVFHRQCCVFIARNAGSGKKIEFLVRHRTKLSGSCPDYNDLNFTDAVVPSDYFADWEAQKEAIYQKNERLQRRSKFDPDIRIYDAADYKGLRPTEDPEVECAIRFLQDQLGIELRDLKEGDNFDMHCVGNFKIDQVDTENPEATRKMFVNVYVLNLRDSRPNLAAGEHEEYMWLEYHELSLKLQQGGRAFKAFEGSKQCFESFVNPASLMVIANKAYQSAYYQFSVDLYAMAEKLFIEP